MGPVAGAFVLKRLHDFDDAIFFFLLIQVATVMVSVASSSLAFALAATGWLMKMWMQRTINVQRTPLDYFFLGYIAAEVLSTAFAIYPQESLVNMKRLFLIGLVYLVAETVQSANRVKVLVGTVVVLGAVLSLVEIASLYVHPQERLHLFQHYMTAGGIKMILILVVVPFVLHRDTPKRIRIWSAVALVPTFMALLLTYTRSAWLGFLAGMTVIGVVKNRWVLPALGVLVGAFFFLAPSTLTYRALSIIDPNDPTVASRLTMWSTGLRIFADHPVVGVGDIDMHEFYGQYKSPDDPEFGGHLHSNFIQLLVTLGSVGFLAVCALFYKTLTTEYRVFQHTKTGWLQGSVSLGALGVFVGFLVAGLFEWNFGDHEIMTLVWATVGLSLASGRLSLS